MRKKRKDDIKKLVDGLRKRILSFAIAAAGLIVVCILAEILVVGYGLIVILALIIGSIIFFKRNK